MILVVGSVVLGLMVNLEQAIWKRVKELDDFEVAREVFVKMLHQRSWWAGADLHQRFHALFFRIQSSHRLSYKATATLTWGSQTFTREGIFSSASLD